MLPELVTDGAWITGETKKFLNVQGMLPYVVGAVREIGTVSGAFRERLVAFLTQWLGTADNGLAVVSARQMISDRMCLRRTDGGDVCISADELAYLLQRQSVPGTSISPQPVEHSTPTTDSTAPIVTLNGEPVQTIEVGTTWSDLGATASDDIGVIGDIEVSIDGHPPVAAGTAIIDASLSATHMLTYFARDAAGNIGTATRIVTVAAPAMSSNSSLPASLSI